MPVNFYYCPRGFGGGLVLHKGPFCEHGLAALEWDNGCVHVCWSDGWTRLTVADDLQRVVGKIADALAKAGRSILPVLHRERAALDVYAPFDLEDVVIELIRTVPRYETFARAIERARCFGDDTYAIPVLERGEPVRWEPDPDHRPTRPLCRQVPRYRGRQLVKVVVHPDAHEWRDTVIERMVPLRQRIEIR